MISVAVGNGTKVTLVGQGFRPSTRAEIAPGILITSAVPCLELKPTAENARSFVDYAAVVHGQPMATFSVEVTDPAGGAALAAKAWNAMYVFHRLSLAAGAPCISLYAEGEGDPKVFAATSPTPILRGIEEVTDLSADHLAWTAEHYAAFDVLHDGSPEFAAGCRCLFGSAYLPDSRVQTMLIWAGIEGLLCVDAELSRRIALYAALLLDDDEAAKHEYYDFVKKAYGARSRIVHGASLKEAKVKQAATDAYTILSRLLRRAVELGRVPLPEELDKMAVAQRIR